MTQNNNDPSEGKLLKKAVNQQAYLKAGLFGFAGSGKTYTAGEIALGLAKLHANGKPVAFMDTETGSDYLIPRFEKEGVPLVVAKTRAFSDLLKIVDEAQKDCSVLIIDSISHIWRDLTHSYTRKMKRSRLTFGDWGILKQEWGEFTDLYLNSQVHILMCGRAGYEYDYFRNDDGKMELTKTGTKMKVETELGYEPSLLLEMERVKEEGKKSWTHKCYVLKDRTDLIHGKVFNNPKFKDFLPVIQFLNIGGEHLAVDTSRTSEALFDGNGNTDRSLWYKRRDIAIEELQNELFLTFPGQGPEAKKQRLELFKSIFNTTSWEAAREMDTEFLEEGLRKLKEQVEEIKKAQTQKNTTA